MRPLRWLAAGLVWIVAGLLGLVGAVLCVTIILLPLGIPILMLSRRLFSLAGLLVLPKAARHPARESRKAVERRGKNVQKAAERGGKALRRRTRKAMAKAHASAPEPVASVVPRPRRRLLGRLSSRR